jgi:hypothetical protein
VRGVPTAEPNACHMSSNAIGSSKPMLAVVHQRPGAPSSTAVIGLPCAHGVNLRLSQRTAASQR